MTTLIHEMTTDARAADYPLARWYLRPLAGLLADVLAPTRVRPWHITCLGLCIGLSAAVLLATQVASTVVAGLLVLFAWLCDRTDGQLARRQQTASPFGAWFDANVDELLDIAWHIAVAAVVSRQLGPSLGFTLLGAFVGGKYLFMYGLSVEPAVLDANNRDVETTNNHTLARALYHAPANADIRVHLLIAALATGWLAAELAAVVIYYNVRWIVRYALVARRLTASSGGGHA